MTIAELRKVYHSKICKEIIRIKREKKSEYPNFADGSNATSRKLAWGIVKHLRCPKDYASLKAQTVGDRFERYTKDFLEQSFGNLQHLRPGSWCYSTDRTAISLFYQYEHLSHVESIFKRDKGLRAALGGDYVIKPDIVVSRWPVEDRDVNRPERIVDKDTGLATLTPLLAENHQNRISILHASVSCKWTIRSDRSQNTRTEALNLIRNRKGHLPHIVAVTAEPLPTRISSLALGTGDLDCVYHFALPELEDSIKEVKNEDQLDMLRMMVEGRRLRDISDLPFDIAI